MLSRDKKTKEKFIDVFALDQFKSFVQNNSLIPGLYIINDQISKENGNHWIALFHQNKKLTFIDSFANHHQTYGIDNEIYNTDFNVFEQIPFRIQDYFSDVCGEYTLFFGYYLCRGKSIEHIMKYFTHDYQNNDLKVRNFIHKTFPGHKR